MVSCVISIVWYLPFYKELLISDLIRLNVMIKFPYHFIYIKQLFTGLCTPSLVHTSRDRRHHDNQSEQCICSVNILKN